MLTSPFVGFGLLLFFGASDPFRCVRACVCVRVCVCVCLVACWNRGRLRLRVPTYLSATGSIGFWSSWFFLSVAGVLKALFLLALKDISIDCH